ncbi:MAG: GntR family transcriptional regulator [Parvibaculaceae bacterium]
MSSRSREIASAIVSAILSHKLLPGTKLGERELSEIFGCSRIVVRQALIRIADEGLVAMERNRGAFVAQPSLKEALEIYDALTLIEQGVAALLIERTKGAHLAELRQQIELQSAALAKGDQSAADELGQEFHTLFVRLAQNRTLEDVHSRLSRQAKLLRALYRSHFDTCVLVNDHLRLVEVMEKGRLRQAQELIASHNRLVARGYDLNTSRTHQIPLELALRQEARIQPAGLAAPPAVGSGRT